MEIIPAIIAKSFDELKAKIKLVESYVKTVQLDVMDGIFVDNKTWPYFAPQSGATNDVPFLDDLDKLETNLMFEAHLMIEAPHRVLNRWLASPKIFRIILHWEALEKIHNHELLPYQTQIDARFPISNLSREIHRCGKQFGMALNPETPIEVLDNFINNINLVTLMSVDPGFAGQELKETVIPKIIALRQHYPDVKIEIDGGVNPQNILKLATAGADFLVVGSSIFQSKNIDVSIKKIKNLLAENNY